MSRNRDLIPAFRGELRRERSLRFSRAFGLLLCSGGLLVLIAVTGAWLVGKDPVPFAGMGWTICAGIAMVSAMFFAPLGARARRRLVRIWDRRLKAGGAILAATHLLESNQSPRLAPLVIAAAGHRVAVSSVRATPIPSMRPMGIALGLVIASAIVILIPSPGPGAGAAAMTAVLGEESAALESRGPQGREDPENEEEAPLPHTWLSSLINLEIAANRRAYLLEEEIHVKATLTALSLLDTDLRLELRLGIADGQPFPDQGFGAGFRTLGFPGFAEIARESGATVDKKMRLLSALKTWKIYRPGLYTLEARAILDSPDAEKFGAVVSNRVTIQVSENRERKRFRQPTPVKKEKQPNAPRKRKQPKKSKGTRGQGEARSGPEDQLPDQRLVPQAVKPLLSDAPLVEKEVEVFDRERGGQSPPRPGRTPEAKETLRPTFQRRPSDVLERLRFSPLEKQLIRRYFGILRRAG